ncbi:MAG: DMT family transporter, partial [Burkholderiales bacterium]|nr:DMT family transporter [Burkholderiales bacterium]
RCGCSLASRRPWRSICTTRTCRWCSRAARACSWARVRRTTPSMRSASSSSTPRGAGNSTRRLPDAAGGQGLIACALAHLPSNFASVGLLLQPVMAAAFAWVLLAEPLGARQVAGGLVVLAGIEMARRASAARRGARRGPPRPRCAAGEDRAAGSSLVTVTGPRGPRTPPRSSRRAWAP